MSIFMKTVDENVTKPIRVVGILEFTFDYWYFANRITGYACCSV